MVETYHHIPSVVMAYMENDDYVSVTINCNMRKKFRPTKYGTETIYQTDSNSFRIHRDLLDWTDLFRNPEKYLHY